jgi:hypothetical protein
MTVTQLAVLLLALCCAHTAFGLTCYVSYSSSVGDILDVCKDQGGDCPAVLKAARARPPPNKSNAIVAVDISAFKDARGPGGSWEV